VAGAVDPPNTQEIGIAIFVPHVPMKLREDGSAVIANVKEALKKWVEVAR